MYILDIQDNSLYIEPEIGDNVKIGTIKDHHLHLSDKDNYHKVSKAIGIDEIILNSDELKYNLIVVKIHGYKYITSRIYFTDHMKRQNLLNFRTMGFLPLKEWGLNKALRYEKRFKAKLAIETMDIFDIMKEDNPRLLKAWISLLDENKDQSKQQNNPPTVDNKSPIIIKRIKL